MIKWFRKHNKQLLAVFGALLLVVWLGSDALTSMMMPSVADQVVAHTRDGDIEKGDQMQAQGYTSLLTQIGLPWANPAGGGAEPLGVNEWIMLNREAKRYGIHIRRVAVEQFLENIGLPPSGVQRLAARQDVKTGVIYEAVRQYLTVQRVLAMVASAATPSEADIRLAARNALEKGRVNMVAIHASNFVDEEWTPDEERIRAHFEQYRTEQRGAGLEFGYAHPARVKVQYIKIDAADVARHVRLGDATLESRARDYWRRNKQAAAFIRPSEPDEAEEKFVGPLQPKSKYFETFEEARDKAIEVVRKEFAQAEVERIAGWLLSQATEPWYNAEVGEDGYKLAPEQVASEAHYEELVEKLPPNLQFGDAVTVTVSPLFAKDEAALEVPGLGTSYLQTTDQFYRFDDLAFLVQGIEPMPSDPEADKSMFHALWQSFPMPIKTRDGNAYVFRVIGVKGPGPAEDLAEAREQVIEDLRLQRAYEQADEYAAQLMNRVTTSDGLKRAFDDFNELQDAIEPPSGFFSPRPLTRGGVNAPDGGTFIAGVGRVSGEFVRECFEIAESVGIPLKKLPVESSALVTVVEWVEKIPLREVEFQQQRGRLANQLRGQVLAQVVNDWVAPERIRDRNNFEFATQ